jgi:aspartate kinase
LNLLSLLDNKQYHKAREHINELECKYLKTVSELFSEKEYIKLGNEIIKQHFTFIKSYKNNTINNSKEKTILAQGELISTTLFHYFLEEQKIPSKLLPALNFMRIDDKGEPQLKLIEQYLKKELQINKDNTLFITQGFICRNSFGEIDNLKRGGSDYTASLIGAAIAAKEVQIWTDIDGMHNNDPRIVDNTVPIKSLSFDEAAELAYFGAKILHPSSVEPAKKKGIPIFLKNTMDPEKKGSKKSTNTKQTGIKAIASKDNITAIKIKSDKMLMAYGFIRKVFEVFEVYKTPIDMISTSEVSVSVTIDNTKYLDSISKQLKSYGEVEVDQNLSIVCIVGDFISESKGYANTIFDTLKSIPIRMISYGGSKHNISILVREKDKNKSLKLLHEIL